MGFVSITSLFQYTGILPNKYRERTNLCGIFQSEATDYTGKPPELYYIETAPRARSNVECPVSSGGVEETRNATPHFTMRFAP